MHSVLLILLCISGADAGITEAEADQILDGLMVWIKTLKRWSYDAGEFKQGQKYVTG